MSFINCPFFDALDPEPICYDIFVTKYYKLFPEFLGYMSVVVGILVLQAGKRSHKSPQKITKKLSNRLDKSFPCWYNGNNEANNTVGSLQGSRYKMAEIEIGQSFTTQKSGVSGTVQEVIKNANGSFRVRLDVNGQPRWTTVTK